MSEPMFGKPFDVEFNFEIELGFGLDSLKSGAYVLTHLITKKPKKTLGLNPLKSGAYVLTGAVMLILNLTQRLNPLKSGAYVLTVS